MILSFHPVIVGDENLICAGRNPGPEELSAIRRAAAVILPQGCRETLYRMARENCPRVFPDYEARFRYPGKTGQAAMFAAFGAASPETWAFASVAELNESDLLNFPYPLVFKPDWGGEGEGVRLLRDRAGLEAALTRARAAETAENRGFVLQRFVPCGGRSLRVVAVHDRLFSYWRVGETGAPLLSGLSHGAAMDREADPHLMALGGEAVRELCLKTGVNLAGFDLIFPDSGPGPLFLEVNYFFGRRGLGGNEGYYEILRDAVSAWLRDSGIV